MQHILTFLILWSVKQSHKKKKGARKIHMKLSNKKKRQKQKLVLY